MSHPRSRAGHWRPWMRPWLAALHRAAQREEAMAAGREAHRLAVRRMRARAVFGPYRRRRFTPGGRGE